KTIESVINEVQMIANQVRQLETMVQNTKGFSRGLWDTDAQPRLLRLGAVIDQERAIAYTMANVDGLFRQRYPGYRPVTDWSSEYELWTRTTLDTLRGTLNSVRLHGEGFATEQGRIQALQAMSESAEGRMQALQVGNMMAAEQLQQLVQLPVGAPSRRASDPLWDSPSPAGREGVRAAPPRKGVGVERPRRSRLR